MYLYTGLYLNLISHFKTYFFYLYRLIKSLYLFLYLVKNKLNWIILPDLYIFNIFFFTFNNKYSLLTKGFLITVVKIKIVVFLRLKILYGYC